VAIPTRDPDCASPRGAPAGRRCRPTRVYAARYRHLTTREHIKLDSVQAQTVIVAAILRHLHAVITSGRAWDPNIATTHGTKAVITTPAVAA